MQLHQQSLTTIHVAFVAMLASAAMPACDKNGSSDKAPSAAKSEQTTPAGSSKAPDKTEPTKAEEPSAMTDDSSAHASQAAAVQAQLDDTCPMLGKDVTVQPSDTPDGAALSFTTTSGDVGEIRRRVRHMAKMYEDHAGHGSMMWHQHGHMRDEGGQGMNNEVGMGNPMPATNAKYEEIEGGARLVFSPRDPKDLDALREQVHDHQRRMSGGECWTPPPGPTGA